MLNVLLEGWVDGRADRCGGLWQSEVSGGVRSWKVSGIDTGRKEEGKKGDAAS